MSGRRHRRLRLCSKKNYERKKYKLRLACITPSDTSVLLIEPPISVDLVSPTVDLRSRLQQLESLNGIIVLVFWKLT